MTKLSEETREKISKSMKEHCAIYGSSRKGATMSIESRKKMSDAGKGKHLSTEARQKLSEAYKGRHWHLENGKHVYTE